MSPASRVRVLFPWVCALFVAAAPAGGLLVPNPWLSTGFLHFAHQGGEVEAPSNTLYAFKRAVALGADVLELDVHRTADGHLVVLHDATVDRTTGGAGRVDALTLGGIKALDAAYWFVPGDGTTHSAPPSAYALRGMATGATPPVAGYVANDFTVPTLREVLEAFPAMPMNVEIKNTAPDTTPYEADLAALLAGYGRGADTIVVSFNDHSTELYRAQGGPTSTAYGLGETAAFYATAVDALPGSPGLHHALQVPVVFNGIPVVTQDFVDDAHANGVAVHVWTINDCPQMQWLIGLGVDGIMTDVPSVLEGLLVSGSCEG